MRSRGRSLLDLIDADAVDSPGTDLFVHLRRHRRQLVVRAGELFRPAPLVCQLVQEDRGNRVLFGVGNFLHLIEGMTK